MDPTATKSRGDSEGDSYGAVKWSKFFFYVVHEICGIGQFMRTNILNFHFNLLYWVSFRGATHVLCYLIQGAILWILVLSVTLPWALRSLVPALLLRLCVALRTYGGFITDTKAVLAASQNPDTTKPPVSATPHVSTVAWEAELPQIWSARVPFNVQYVAFPPNRDLKL